MAHEAHSHNLRFRCGLVHVEPDVFRMLPRVETLGLRDNDLDCLPVEELSHMRMLRAVRIDGNPWLCECRMRLDRFFRERSIVQEERCKLPPGVYRSLQCMTQIDIPILFPIITVEQIGGHEVSRDTEFYLVLVFSSRQYLGKQVADTYRPLECRDVARPCESSYPPDIAFQANRGVGPSETEILGRFRDSARVIIA